MSLRKIGLDDQEIEVEVFFCGELHRERGINDVSPALVPLAVVKKIVEDLQKQIEELKKS